MDAFDCNDEEDRGGGGGQPTGPGRRGADDAFGPSAYVEEVVAGHSGLAGHAGRDDDDLGTLEGLLEAVVLGREADGLHVARGEVSLGARDRSASLVEGDQLTSAGVLTCPMSAETPIEPRMSNRESLVTLIGSRRGGRV